MKLDRAVKDLLNRAGAQLKRSRKHLVFGLPNGRNVVLASSPSDFRASNNQIRDIRKIAGITEPPIKKAAVKRDKPGRRGEPRWKPEPPRFGLAEQLSANTNLLQLSIDVLTKDAARLKNEALVRETEIAALRAVRHSCLLCRLRDWWRR